MPVFWDQKFCFGPVVFSFEIWVRPAVGQSFVGCPCRPHYIWASKVLMYFGVVCVLVVQWIAKGCYFYFFLMLDYCFVEFEIVYWFR
jgi:hypothetical protein